MVEPISRAEAYVVWKLAAGEIANLQSDEANLPEADRRLPASFIRGLLLGLPASDSDHQAVAEFFGDYDRLRSTTSSSAFPVALPGVRIREARVEGCLDLRDCRGPGGAGLGALSLEKCLLHGGSDPAEQQERVSIDISHASLGRVSLRGSRLTYLRAQGVQLNGSLDLTEIGPLGDWVAQSWRGVNLPEYIEWAQYVISSEFEEKYQVPNVNPSRRGHHQRRKKPRSLRLEQHQGQLVNDGTLTKKDRPEEPHITPWPRSSIDHCWVNLTASVIHGRLILRNSRLRIPPPRPEESINQTATNFALCFENGEARTIIADGLVAEGGISLEAVKTSGDISLIKASLLGGESSALNAISSNIGGHMIVTGSDEDGPTLICNTHHRSDTKIFAVDLYGAHISGGLHFRQAWIDCLSLGSAIDGRHMVVGGILNLGDLFYCRGRLELSNTSVSSNVQFDNAFMASYRKLSIDPNSPDKVVNGDQSVLVLANAKIGGDLTFLSVQILGELYLSDISVTGSLTISAVVVSDIYIGNIEEKHVAIRNISIGGNLTITYTAVFGEISLVSTEIGGDANIYYVRIWGIFDFSRLDVRGGCYISGSDFYDEFKGTDMVVRDSISVTDVRFHALADWRNASAKNSTFVGVSIAAGMRADGMKVSTTLKFIPTYISGDVSLREVTCDEYCDNASTWSEYGFWKQGKLLLNGMQYKRIRNIVSDGNVEDSVHDLLFVRRLWLDRLYRRSCRSKPQVKVGRQTSVLERVVGWFQNTGGWMRATLLRGVWRLSWLGLRLGRPVPRRGTFQPQPYVQLANALAEQGHEHEARQILVERRRVETAALPIISPVKWVNLLYDLFFAYGFSPVRALLWLCAFIMVGAVGTEVASRTGALVANVTSVAGTAIEESRNSDGQSPAFAAIPVQSGASKFLKTLPCRNIINPTIYAVDVFVPLVDLKQESRCDIGIAPGHSVFLDQNWTIRSPQLHINLSVAKIDLWRYAKAIYAIIGLIMTSLSTLTFSGILRRWSSQ